MNTRDNYQKLVSLILPEGILDYFDIFNMVYNSEGLSTFFYSAVILSIAFFIKGTTIKPVGMESHNSTRKYLKNHICKKSAVHPVLVNNKPKVIVPDIAIETKNVNTIIDCILDNFFRLDVFMCFLF